MEISAIIKGNKRCDICDYNVLSLGCSDVFFSAQSARWAERSELCKLSKPVREF
jgi:hypothetical protein